MVILYLCSLTAAAQNTEESLQNKYFTCRNRLEKWFVTANGSPGGGYPIENIRLYQDRFGYPFSNRRYLLPNGNDSIISETDWNKLENLQNTETSGSIVTDNLLIMVGEYLSVLSTELWLLKHYKMQETE